ncbi:MAG: alkaline phosphatase, partial [Lysobacterales bacterium]
ETHGGEDVPVYATGPGADQVRGVIEQNLLFRLLVQAQPALRAELCRRQACPEQPRAAWAAPTLPR